MSKKQIEEKLIDQKKRISDAITKLNLDSKESELDVLESETQNPSFWNDQKNAQAVMQKVNALKTVVLPWRKIERNCSDVLELLATSNDESILPEAEKEVTIIEKELAEHEKDTYFSGKYDNENAIISVYAGAGGVDAQDWAQMLLSMFLKYAGLKNLGATVVHQTSGQEAGIKSASVEITGPLAYGLLKSERGVHRLVRISPYDADKARHTSFALVEVIPEIENQNEKIDEKDLRVETYRASGHGGQSVNTTDSAVRIIHIPTGVTVTCQNERSQLQNKEKALKILKARVAVLQEADREKELKIIKGESMSAEWGSQIRSYVLHPYTMVKDHRTNAETSNVQSVLDGNLDEFVEAYLKH